MDDDYQTRLYLMIASTPMADAIDIELLRDAILRLNADTIAGISVNSQVGVTMSGNTMARIISSSLGPIDYRGVK